MEFETIEESDVYSHIYDVSSRAKTEKRLGYVNRNTDDLELTLPSSNISLHIKQSMTGLSSSTGFVCWQSALYLIDWIISDEKCPFKFTKTDTIVELGTGIGAITVSTLGPKVYHYIATDQIPLLKLLKLNFENNVQGKYNLVESRQELVAKGANVSIIAFDWEDIRQGDYNLSLVLEEEQQIQFILAADTIYNEYLVDHFIDSFLEIMTENTKIIMALQLRDEELIAYFCDKILQRNLKLSIVKEQFLSEHLRHGFLVYYIGKK